MEVVVQRKAKKLLLCDMNIAGIHTKFCNNMQSHLHIKTDLTDLACGPTWLLGIILTANYIIMQIMKRHS